VEIDSTLANTCFDSIKPDFPLFQCVNPEMVDDEITEQSILDSYNTQFDLDENDVYYGRAIANILELVQRSWKVYILAPQVVKIQGSNIKGSRVGICSNQIYS
jgi:hypothetical protein